MSHRSQPDPLFADYADDFEDPDCRLRVELLAGTAGRERRTAERRQQQLRLTQLELVGSSPSQKNWKAIVIALAVIASILALIGSAVVIVTPARTQESPQRPITFEEAMTWPRHLRRLQYQWRLCDGVDSLFFLNATSGHLMRLTFNSSAQEFNIEVALLKDQVKEGRIRHFSVSPDCRLALLRRNFWRSEFGAASTAEYSIIGIGKNRFRQTEVCKSPPCSAANRFHHAEWGNSGVSLLMTQDESIFYTKDAAVSAASLLANRLGPLAKVDASDEITDQSVKSWPSPNGTHLAYLQLNTTGVKKYSVNMYGSAANLYTRQVYTEYAKAGVPDGAALPQATVMVQRLPHGQKLKMPLPAGADRVTGLSWLSEGRLLVTAAARNRSRGLVCVCAIQGETCRLWYSDSQPHGWSDIRFPDDAIGDKTGDRVFAILRNGGAARIALIESDGLKRWLTPTDFDVFRLLRADSTSVQFLSCRTNSGDCDSTVQHVHRWD